MYATRPFSAVIMGGVYSHNIAVTMKTIARTIRMRQTVVSLPLKDDFVSLNTILLL